MTKSRTSPARRARIGTAVLFAGLTAGALAGPGLVSAQDYPPQPPTSNETTTTTSIVVSGPAAPQAPIGGQQAGSLPSTGNSDVTSSLMIAGAALLAGMAITGVATASRRRDTPDAPTSAL